MKNSERTVFPIEQDWKPELSGLTKREYFAGIAMQGALAGGYGIDSVKAAVQFADELLEELSKP